MGAWGTGSFENDDAEDWIFDLVESDIDFLDESLRAVRDEEYVEAPEASAALAAAEVVAASLGRPSPNLPDELKAWIFAHPRASSLSASAIAAVDIIANDTEKDSELDELWQESEQEYDAWRAVLKDLRARLESVA